VTQVSATPRLRKSAHLAAVAIILSVTTSVAAPRRKDLRATPTQVATSVTLVSVTSLLKFRKSQAYKRAAKVPIIRQGRLAYVRVEQLSHMADTTLVVIGDTSPLAPGTPVLVAEVL
jgi:hypothetical protein